MPKKADIPSTRDGLTVSGLSSKTVTGVATYVHGSVAVIEVNYSGGPVYFKVKGLQIEIGGTNEWGTGTIQ